MSRTTVRSALDDLVRAGLVERKQGKGTFVRHPELRQDVVSLASCEHDLKSQDLEPGLELLGVKVVGSDSVVSHALEVEPDTPVTRISRLRLANGVPVCHDVTYLPRAIGDRLNPEELRQERICSLLSRKLNLKLTESRLTFRAAGASAQTARLLAVDLGAPLFVVDICTFVSLGWAVEFQRREYRGDRLSYIIRLATVEELKVEGTEPSQAQILALDRIFA